MPTLVIDRRTSVTETRGPARVPCPPRLLAWGTGLLVCLIAGGTAGHRWYAGPDRVAADFLSACREADTARIERLLEVSFRRSAPAGELPRLLRRLHERVPRTVHAEVSGPRSSGGLVTERDHHMVLVRFAGDSQAAREHRRFSLTLERGPDGAWRVAFMPTYTSLFTGLDGGQGAAFLDSAISQSLGRRASLVAGWRNRAPRSRGRK